MIAVMVGELFGAPSAALRDIRVDGDALVVVGTTDTIARVRALVRPPCEGPPPGDARVEVVPIRSIDATALARTLSPRVPPGVTLVVDEATNSLVIRGPGRARAELTALAQASDVVGR